jgi:negative regulator of sigma E activity
VPEDGAYERGVTAGEIAQRLHAHDEHFQKLNGSMDGVAKALNGLTLAVQRLGDAADADRATVKTTAEALEKAELARRNASKRQWAPLTRIGVAAAAVAALASVVTLWLGHLHR